MRPRASDRPNILWYCTDQQRFDTISALGNPHLATPTLDTLVREGTSFTRAYCQSPICTPSRASFLTGMYPSRIRNCRNGNESWPDHPPLISRLLADAGYDCGLVGKFHLQSSGRRTEPRLDDGYRYWRFSHAPRDDWPDGHDYGDWVEAGGGDLDALRASEERVPPELHQSTWVTECALEFLQQPRSGPWFLTLNPYDPHPPFIPPRAYAERFDPDSMPGPHYRPSDLEQQQKLSEVAFQTLAEPPERFDAKRLQASYYAMIAQLDDQFARLLAGLEASGQRENTLILFTSDHGEMLGDHGLLYKGCRFYEGLVRVPLLFSWPGIVRGDLRSDALVELIDIAATLLEVAGLEAPEAMQGRSLWPILTGSADPAHHRPFVRSEYFDALDASIVHGGLSFATMYRDERYKLTAYHSHGTGELYDLQADPWEFDDLWDHPKYQTLKRELLGASFHASMLASIDVGTRRIAPM